MHLLQGKLPPSEFRWLIFDDEYRKSKYSIIYTKSPDATFASFNPEDIPLKDSEVVYIF
jgi:hypothetical protein